LRRASDRYRARYAGVPNGRSWPKPAGRASCCLGLWSA